MGILDRVARVVRANVNELLNAAEDPEKLLNQHILDMEDAVRQARSKVVEVAAQEKLARQAMAARRADVDKWQVRAEEAVKGGDDALARQALGVKRGVAQEVAELERQVEVQAQYTRTLEESLAALDRKLRETKDEAKRLKVELARKEIRDAARRHAPGGARPADTSAVHDEESFAVFDRMADKVEARDLEAEALREVDAAVRGGREDEAELERRFQELARGRQADDDLAELKRKLDR